MNRKAAITECIAALKKQAVADGVDLSAELDEIGKKVGRFVNPRDAWDLVRRARDPERLRASEVIAGVFDEFTELHGDLVNNLRLAMSVFLNDDPRDAIKLLEEKTRFTFGDGWL